MSQKPDLIVSWPDNCDYPLWRQFIRDHRIQFDQVIVIFTVTHQSPRYAPFVRDAMDSDGIVFANSPILTGHEDWRNRAVNFGLNFSRNEWVWFTEQDFYPTPVFWAEVYNAMLGYDVIAAYDGTRMHPCCIFARRETVDKTHCNFGIVPDKLDHFGLFQRDLEASGCGIAKVSEKSYLHYNGLSSNFTLITKGEMPNYKPEEFTKYIEQCLSTKVPISDEFRAVCERYLQKVR